ncbi:MAG: hypothetical protein Q8L14_17010 [Myxococcales bacterium]|nr:hypothetical protein [Myxococcales bacterium]
MSVTPAARPSAIWTAFAAQGRWKNYVLGGQLLLQGLLIVVMLKVARTEPSVVVVDESGAGHFVERGVATEALLAFLANQKGAPSALTLESFSKRFLRVAAAPNSSMLEEQWAEALAMMASPLAAKMDEEARSQKLFETYRLAQVKTHLEFLALDVIEQHGDKVHVRARLARRRESLVSAVAGVTDDSQQVDLVLSHVPRTRARPDGLMVVEWRTTTLPAAPAPALSPSAP